jgi:hypothetical protein
MGATMIFQGDAVNPRILIKEQLENLLSFTFKLFKEYFYDWLCNYGPLF